jgi:hypothetical protein
VQILKLNRKTYYLTQNQMKKSILTAFFCLLMVMQSFAYVTISYYNKDSKSYKWKVTMDGNIKEVSFDGSKTSTVTVQGSGKVCIIETECGKIEVKDGAKIEIKDGCIKVL